MPKKTEAKKSAAKLATAKPSSPATKVSDPSLKTPEAVAKARAHVTGAATKVGSKAGGFMTFVREQGIIGLAVGLAIGAQAAELVKIIVGSLVTPIIDLIIGKGGLAGLKWTLTLGERSATFTFGDLIDALLRFLAVALVIYLVIHGFKLDRLDKKKEG